MPTERHIADATIRPGVRAAFSLRHYHGRDYAVIAELNDDGSIRKRLLIRVEFLLDVIANLEAVAAVAFKLERGDELTTAWRATVADVSGA